MKNPLFKRSWEFYQKIFKVDKQFQKKIEGKIKEQNPVGFLYISNELPGKEMGGQNLTSNNFKK